MPATKKHSKIIKIAAVFFITASAIFLLANFSLAADANLGLNYAEGTGLSNQVDIRVAIARIIRIALGFLGIITVGLIIYAGFLWMTSGGNEEKIEQAKKILTNAAIGLIIILSSFALASFILSKLIGATGGSGLNGSGGGGGGSGFGVSGGEIVDYTFPADNQENVPRNLRQVTAVLNEPVDSLTFKADTAEIRVYTVDPVDINREDKIYKSRLAAQPAASFFGRWLEKLPLVNDLLKDFRVGKALAADAADPAPALGPALSDVKFQVAPNGKTLIFNLSDRKEYLGSPKQAVWYFVTLKKTILKPDGASLFSDLSGQGGDIGYHWKFAVGTVIDNTPPKIISVIPRPDATEPRNVVAQINFSEAIDPTSASGKLECGDAACASLRPDGFNNIVVRDITAGEAVNKFIAGNLYISNQYRTVEYLTFDDCGLNSCGQTIFCLPADKRIKVSIKAATLAESPAATAIYTDNGYDGVVDMAGNSLDGNGNGSAQGPQAQSHLPPYNANNSTHPDEGDDYYWAFNTDGRIDKTAPKIISVAPSLGSNQADTAAVPEAVFDKWLFSASLTKSSVAIKKSNNQEFYYWVYYRENSSASPVPAISERRGTVSIGHSQFDYTTRYSVQLNAGIKDNYQNCYLPCSGLGVTGNPSCCEGAPAAAGSCP